MDSATILKLIGDLKRMGVFWLGFTGGEPLLNKDIVEITERAAGSCAVKLFTTGTTLTRELALDLKKAGLFSVSVSLDHWTEKEHDRIRGTSGAFRTAIKAIEIFKNLSGLHIGVSAVLSKEMIVRDQTEELLAFLIRLGVDEAWLSETKPSVAAFWNQSLVITEEERLKLVNLQDRANAEGKITVNYLGHFEGREHFGCNAGNKMVYIDAFGEVSPCVFAPMTFGNIQERPVQEIFREMKRRFPSQDHCFINGNFRLLQKYFRGASPLPMEDSVRLMDEVEFGPLSGFFKLYYS
jgi:MoaA/NifB/PqqE/SkfB family radical SAM enzyme